MTTDDSSIFKDVCSLLSELDSAKLVNKAAKQEILNGLLKKSEGELPGNARRDLLHLLGQLGIVNSQALLTVLQSLTDEDVRYAICMYINIICSSVHIIGIILLYTYMYMYVCMYLCVHCIT